eukprot:89721-Rhodomonas_salina.2
MSGSDIAHSNHDCLRGCYGMSGTDTAYGATSGLISSSPDSVKARYCLLSAYARAMRCPVLTYRMILSVLGVRY